MDNTEDCIGVPFRDSFPTREEIDADPKLEWCRQYLDEAANDQGEEANEQPDPENNQSAPLNLTHASMARMLCLAPHLFRPLKRGQRKKNRLHIAYRYNEHIDMEFNAPELLGADDMRMLQVLVALGAARGETVTPGHASGSIRALHHELQLRNDSQSGPIRVFEISINELAFALGYEGHSGPKYRAIELSINRLAAVVVDAAAGGLHHGMNLISAQNERQNAITLNIALCPLLLQGIASQRRYTRIDFDEVRRIPTEPGRILHQRLCGWIDPNKTGTIGIDTLCGYLWTDAVTSASQRVRRVRAYKALQALENAGWKVARIAPGKLTITRHC